MQDVLLRDNTKYITVIEVVQQIHHVSGNKTNLAVLFDVDAFGGRECDWFVWATVSTHRRYGALLSPTMSFYCIEQFNAIQCSKK